MNLLLYLHFIIKNRFVARKDQLKDAHGGVAIISRSDMDGVKIDIQTSTEFVAASFPCTSLKKPLIVGGKEMKEEAEVERERRIRNARSQRKKRPS